MAKQLVLYNGKYYFVDEVTLEIKEVHIDQPVVSNEQQREILKIFVKENMR